MADTRRRILDTARGLFNAQGVSRVGVRDVARALGMSPGNLAYHFATKDDLVAALVLELYELNAKTVFADLPESFSVITLYHAAKGAMRNMLAYRFVLLGYVDAIGLSPELRKLHATLLDERRRRFDRMVALLGKNGCIDVRAVRARADRLFEQGEMISSGWLARESVLPEPRDDESAIRHYAKLGCALLEPHCTPKGARELRHVLAGSEDRVTRGAARRPS